MLNKEALDIKQAKLLFDININRSDLYNSINKCDFYICQYFINNTCYDLTVMDNIGFRQTLPRKNNRVGDRVFQVIREYRIVHTYEDHARNFFDEIRVGDGKVLEALKEVVGNKDFFKTKGFGDACRQNAQTGYMFTIVFDIHEDQFRDFKSVNCEELSIVVSRLKREIMPSNLVYSHQNKGSYHPFIKTVGKKFSMTRTIANYHRDIKERYWYTIADKVQEVEYVTNENLEEGIHVLTYTRDLTTETTIENRIKFINFNDASNKNGFFISDRDAMLSVNVERTLREREAVLKERAHTLKEQEVDLDERNQKLRIEEQQHLIMVNNSKKELAILKQQAEEVTLRNSVLLEELRFNNLVKKERLNNTSLMYEEHVLEKKMKYGLFDLSCTVIKQAIEVDTDIKKHELNNAKHEKAMQELKYSSQISESVHAQKLQAIELDMHVSSIVNQRKVLEERSKLGSGALNMLGTLMKTIGF